MIIRKTIKGKVKVMGTIVKDELQKTVHLDDHFFRAANAWGIDLDTWDANKAFINYIQLHEIKEGRIYRVSKDIFQAKGFNKEFSGFGTQRFLQINFWDIYEAKTFQRIYQYVPPEPKIEQPTLF